MVNAISKGQKHNSSKIPSIVADEMVVSSSVPNEPVHTQEHHKPSYADHKSNDKLYARKIPKTTAIKRGLWTRSNKYTTKVTTKVVVEDADDSDGSVVPKHPQPSDESDIDVHAPRIEDNWEPSAWFDFICDDDDDDYFSKLYKNGEFYKEKDFGKIILRPWMIFTEKSHFKDTLKDYCIQERVSITVLCADRQRYTVTCVAKYCDWRIHASRLADGATWVIKKI
ncbi:Phosphoribosylformylglycinamidine synthase subunit PurL [Bienertia sinuspersici]